MSLENYIRHAVVDEALKEEGDEGLLELEARLASAEAKLATAERLLNIAQNNFAREREMADGLRAELRRVSVPNIKLEADLRIAAAARSSADEQRAKAEVALEAEIQTHNATRGRMEQVVAEHATAMATERRLTAEVTSRLAMPPTVVREEVPAKPVAYHIEVGTDTVGNIRFLDLTPKN